MLAVADALEAVELMANTLPLDPSVMARLLLHAHSLCGRVRPGFAAWYLKPL